MPSGVAMAPSAPEVRKEARTTRAKVKVTSEGDLWLEETGLCLDGAFWRRGVGMATFERTGKEQVI